MFQELVKRRLIILKILFLCSFFIFLIRFNNLESVYDSGDANLNGEIVDYYIEGDLLSFTLKAKELVKCFYNIKSYEEKEYLINNILRGINVYVSGVLNKEEVNTIPNTFNYSEYLKSVNIYHVMSVEELKINDDDISFINGIRSYLMRDDVSVTNSYINALIFADQSFMNEEIVESYRINGISHLFAISGMHVGLLCLFLRKLLCKIKYYKLFIYLFLVMYLFITDFPPSLCRAVVFFLILDVFKLNSLYSLLFTVLILLVVNPNLYLNLGFRYSVVTTFFLIYCKFEGVWFVKLFKISFVAFFASLPVTINTFYEFNMFSVFINVIFGPIVSFLLYPLTLLTYIFSFLEPFYFLIILLFEKMSLFFNEFKLLINIPKMSLIFIIIYYSGLLFFRGINLKLFMFLISVLLLVKFSLYFDWNGYVYYLDVGQGDSSLIISPYRKDIVLIDSGGEMEYPKEEWQLRDSFTIGDTIVVFLKSLGITKIDLVVLSHGDIDHVKEMSVISEEINFSNVLLNKGSINEYERLFVDFKNDYVSKNMKFDVLDTPLYDNENDNSIINYVTIYDTKLLFLGDVSKHVELELLKYKLNCDILKLGHHGSSTSTDEVFIQNISPSVGIISSGLNNRFGHPHEEVLSILNKHNIQVYNTTYSGTVVVKINKNGYTILK